MEVAIVLAYVLRTSRYSVALAIVVFMRLRFTDEPQVGEARSHIVERELHAFLQKRIEHPEKIRSVRYRIMLGEFQNDL